MTLGGLRAATVAPALRQAQVGAAQAGEGEGRVHRAMAIAPPAAPVIVAKPCPVCKKPAMENPWAAGCGHQACYGCWLKALAAMACPVCNKRTHKRNLSKAYFQ